MVGSGRKIDEGKIRREKGGLSRFRPSLPSFFPLVFLFGLAAYDLRRGVEKSRTRTKGFNLSICDINNILFLVVLIPFQSPVDRESPFRFLASSEDDVRRESIKSEIKAESYVLDMKLKK